MNKTTLLLAAGLLCAAFIAPARAQDFQYSLQANKSQLGYPPTHPYPTTTDFYYVYDVIVGQAVTDKIPFDICLDKYPNDLSWTDTVTATVTNDTASLASVKKTDYEFVANLLTKKDVDNNCPRKTGNTFDHEPGLPGKVRLDIPGTLTAGIYESTITFDPGAVIKDSFITNPTASIDPTKIHIIVNVAGPSNTTACFFTDSDGNFLQKCNGDPANLTGERDGTFAIVTNAKDTTVATNPGEFYYNLLWNNLTGSDQTVTVSFAPLTGLSPVGSQALHWLTLPTEGGVTVSDFSEVIEGNPAGRTGPISNIIVPANDTLYVTYHLEWNGLGAPPPTDCGIGCDNANQLVLVDATVSNDTVDDECNGGAVGYLKQ